MTPFNCLSPIPVSDWAEKNRERMWKPHERGQETQHVMGGVIINDDQITCDDTEQNRNQNVLHTTLTK